MKNTAVDNKDLSFKIDPKVVFVNTKPQQQAFVNIKVEIKNESAAPLQISGVAIILPETITTTPKGVITTPDDLTVWSFQLSSSVKNQFEAKPVKTTAVTVAALQTTTFYLQTVKLVKTVATDLVQVTVKVNVVGQPQVVKLLDVDVQSATASIENFSVTPATIKPGTAATLSWDCKSIDHVIIEPGVKKTSAKDTAIVSPLTTTLYTLYAYGDGVILFAQLTVAVKNVDVRFTSNMDSKFTLGDMVTLEWTCNQYVENAKLSDNKGIIQPEKKFTGDEARHKGITVGPVRDFTTFKFLATADAVATRDSQWTAGTIMIDNVVDVAATFTATPNAVKQWKDNKVRLEWNIVSAATVTITPALANGPSLQKLSGYVEIIVERDVTYTLTVTGFLDNKPHTINIPVAVKCTMLAFNKFTATKINPGPYARVRIEVQVTADGLMLYESDSPISTMRGCNGGEYIFENPFFPNHDNKFTLWIGSEQNPKMLSKTITLDSKTG